MDQFVVKTPGRLCHGYRKESTKNTCSEGTILINTASRFIFVGPQISLSAAETVLAKQFFEEYLQELAVVKVKHYHSENVVFCAQEFWDDCKEND